MSSLVVTDPSPAGPWAGCPPATWAALHLLLLAHLRLKAQCHEILDLILLKRLYLGPKWRG